MSDYPNPSFDIRFVYRGQENTFRMRGDEGHGFAKPAHPDIWDPVLRALAGARIGARPDMLVLEVLEDYGARVLAVTLYRMQTGNREKAPAAQ